MGIMQCRVCGIQVSADTFKSAPSAEQRYKDPVPMGVILLVAIAAIMPQIFYF